MHKPHEAGRNGGSPASGVPGPAPGPASLALSSSFGSLGYFVSPLALKLIELGF